MLARDSKLARPGGGFLEVGGGFADPGMPPPWFPKTGPEFLARTGISPTALYLFNEASGSVLDQVGANHLAVAEDPTFAYSLDGRLGVHYDEANDGHRADVCALGSGSGIYGTVFKSIADLGSNHVIGRINSPITECADIDIPSATNNLRAVVRDDGVNSLILTINTVNVRAQLGLALLQIDRAAAVARLGYYHLTGYVEASGSIAGFSSLNGAGQSFGFGQDALAARAGGCANFHGFFALGAQCEGATTPLVVARRLGWGG